VHSQRVLLALTQAGVSREDAYRLVQRNAMKVWDFLLFLVPDLSMLGYLASPRTGAVVYNLAHGYDRDPCLS
jgi:hypothetical protein